MTFLNPLVLLGLIAGAIPIILHLLNLRKLKTIEFSSLKFLKELQKTKIRKLKLKQILLLILRTLLIVFTVLAFSRPTIEGSLPGFETFAKTSVAILIDNSFSMDVSDEWGNRFNQSKTIGNEILNLLKEGDEVVIIPMASKEIARVKGLTKSINLAREDLNKIKIEIAKADLVNSLNLAEIAFESAANINHEIFVITDCQPNILFNEELDSLNLFKKKTPIYIIPIGLNSRADIQNISVDSINLITRMFQVNKPIELEVKFKNHSMQNINGIIAGLIFNNQRVTQRTFNIESGRTKNIAFTAVPNKTGLFTAYIEVESDALDYDNRRYFSFYIPSIPKVLLTGNRASTQYIIYALAGAGININEFVDLFNPENLSSVDFNKYDVVVCTEGNYRQSDLLRLYQFIANGGSALLFANTEDIGDNYSQFLANLGVEVSNIKYFSSSQPAYLTSLDKMHPIFEGVFKGTTDKTNISENIEIFKAKPAKSGQFIIEMPGGAFFTEIRKDNGRVYYCAVSPVMDWSRFPITGLFPTLIYRSVMHLSATENIAVNALPMQKINIVLPIKLAIGNAYKVLDPSGVEFFSEALKLPSGYVLSLDELRNTGVYSVYNQNDRLVSLVNVNHSPDESEISPLKESEFISLLKSKIGEHNIVRFLKNTQNVSKDISRARLGTELWKIFLILAILCMIGEMIVARVTKNEALGST